MHQSVHGMYICILADIIHEEEGRS